MTYVPDKYVKGMMNSTGCSVEEAIASTNKDPNNAYNTGMPDNEYIEEALDLQFKKNHEAYKQRNLRFYKLLGQNYDSLVNGILRGKDIMYKIPKRYEMNTKHPFVLDWLLLYGRPEKIAGVRQMGPVKLTTIYNALVSWCEQNPNESKNWIYEKEWREYFSTNQAVIKREKKNYIEPSKDDSIDMRKYGGVSQYTPSKIEEQAKKIKEASSQHKDVNVSELKSMLPELHFIDKRHNKFTNSMNNKDIMLSIITKAPRGTNKSPYLCLNISIRPSGLEKIKGDYINFAILKDRFYIKEMDAETGYKLTSKGSCKYAQIVLTPELNEQFLKFDKKCYNLLYDEMYELYYGEV